MDRTQQYQQINDLLDTINEQQGALEQHTDSVPQIELDIILTNIRKLYDLYRVIEKESGVKPGTTRKSAKQTPPKALKEVAPDLFGEEITPVPVDLFNAPEIITNSTPEVVSTNEEKTVLAEAPVVELEPVIEMPVVALEEIVAEEVNVDIAEIESEQEILVEPITEEQSNEIFAEESVQEEPEMIEEKMVEAEPIVEMPVFEEVEAELPTVEEHAEIAAETELEEEIVYPEKPVSLDQERLSVFSNTEVAVDIEEEEHIDTFTPVAETIKPIVSEDVLVEKFANVETAETLHEKILLQSDDNSLASRLKKQPIADLRTAIGINEKFLFINEIFNSDAVAYSNSVDFINQCKTYAEATIYVNNILKPRYHWSTESKRVSDFLELVERRFL